MSCVFDISLQSARRSFFNVASAFLFCTIALSATQASAGQPGKVSKANPLQNISFVAKPVAGPILDPKLVTQANTRPVFSYRSIPSQAPQQMEMSHEQVLVFIATKPRPPETGPLADLFRSARPVMAPDMLAPHDAPSSKSADINVAMAK